MSFVARFMKGLLALVAIAVVLIGGYAVFIFYRPDLYVTGLNRYISEHAMGQPWGTPIALVPAVFDAGTSRARVKRSLYWSGYGRDAWVWRGLRPSFEGGEVTSRKADRFPCNIRYYVVTKFDASDRLQQAEALVQEHGCL